MSKKETNFEIGDKFILTISEKYEPAGTEAARQDSPDALYRMNGFKSLVFDAEGLRKLKRYEPPKPIDIEAIRDDAFYNGAREAWETAQLIVCVESDGGMSSDELVEIFGTNWADDIFSDYSFTDARDKIKAYIAKKKAEEDTTIHVGDEITVSIFPEWGACVVTLATPSYLYCMTAGGETHFCGNKEATKTGRSFPEVVKALEALKNDA